MKINTLYQSAKLYFKYASKTHSKKCVLCGETIENKQEDICYQCRKEVGTLDASARTVNMFDLPAEDKPTFALEVEKPKPAQLSLFGPPSEIVEKTKKKPVPKGPIQYQMFMDEGDLFKK